jgi:hypothetical protein
MKLLFAGVVAGLLIATTTGSPADRDSPGAPAGRTIHVQAGQEVTFGGVAWRCLLARLPDPVGVLGVKSSSNAGRLQFVCTFRPAKGPCEVVALTNPYLWVAARGGLAPTGTGASWARTRVGCKVD